MYVNVIFFEDNLFFFLMEHLHLFNNESFMSFLSHPVINWLFLLPLILSLKYKWHCLTTSYRIPLSINHFVILA